MTDEVWIKCVPFIIKGLKNHPVVQKYSNPKLILTMDGYKSHINNVEAMASFQSAGIYILKEKADSSHVNQPYDQHRALADKKAFRLAMDMIRLTGKASQQLMVASIIEAIKANTTAWSDSFKKVNLHPHHRKPLAGYLEEIAKKCTSEDSKKTFDEATKNKMLFYSLPDFFQYMSVEQRNQFVSLLDKTNGIFSTVLVKELMQKFSIITLNDVVNLSMVYFSVKEFPWLLDYDEIHSSSCDDQPESENLCEQAARNGKETLHSYTLLPKHIVSKEEKLRHAIKFRKLHAKDHDKPSSYLDIEVSDIQRNLFAVQPNEMTLNNIMQDTVGEKAKNKIVERKLDHLGLVSADPTFFTDENIKRLNEHKNLALITSQIRRETQIIADEVAKEEQDELTREADNTFKKYIEKGGTENPIHFDWNLLTVKELKSITLVCYKQTFKKSIAKTPLISVFAAKVTENPIPFSTKIYQIKSAMIK